MIFKNMPESLGDNPPHDPDKDNIHKLNEEVKESLAEEMKEAGEILKYLNAYLFDNHQNLDGQMPLGEFLDSIDREESGFSREVRDIIHVWLGRYEDEIKLENSINNFMDFVATKEQDTGEVLE